MLQRNFTCCSCVFRGATLKLCSGRLGTTSLEEAKLTSLWVLDGGQLRSHPGTFAFRSIVRPYDNAINAAQDTKNSSFGASELLRSLK